MSGFGDPYRHPRDDRGGRGFDQRDERGGGGRGRGGYGGGRGGGQGGRRDYDERGYGGAGGGRGRGWDDDGGRDSKRGRYEDYDRARGSPYGRDERQHPPPPQHGHSAQPSHAYQPHAQPAYPPQQQHYSQAQPSPVGYAAAPGFQAEAAAAPPPRAKGPVQPEPVSASVIFLGLPPHAVDIHLRQFLENMGASVDSTTVIMDRVLGASKGFGFAKFSSVEHARAFVEPNFPSIPWREPSGPAQYDGMRVKINYSQKTGGWREDQGATARLTDNLREAEGASQSFYVNDGTRDIGSAPSSTLLLRGLDPLTGEDEVFSTLARVGGRANQEIAKGGVRRVMLAKDRASRSSWGFAFVQFTDVRLATDVLGAIFNPRFHPAGFRIRSAIVAASFAHENSLIPVYAASNWSFRGDAGGQLAYWDDKGYLAPWTPPPPADLEKIMQNVPKGPRAHEEAKAEADLAAFFDDLEAELPPDEAPTSVESAAALGADAAAASAATSDMATSAPPGAAAPPPPPSPAPLVAAASSAPPPPPGSTAPISIKPISSATAATVTAMPAAVTPSSSGPTASKADAPSAASAAALGAKEKKSDLIASRKAAPNIAKWNVKAKEIRKPAAAAGTSATKTSAAASTPSASTAATAPANLPPVDAPPSAPASAPASPAAEAADDGEFAHGDPIAFVCLLCQRQFKGVDELRKHNKLSALHKTNLANPDVVAASTARKVASLKKHAASPSPAAAAASAPTKPKYVDRAAARRDVHGAIDEGPVGGAGAKKRKFDGPEPPAPAPAAPNKDGLEESNAGRKMLEKMGWTAGAGLGATGDGRVAPVQAAQFQQGAGLGSTKGVAVGEEVPTSHAERMRLKALERFEK